MQGILLALMNYVVLPFELYPASQNIWHSFYLVIVGAYLSLNQDLGYRWSWLCSWDWPSLSSWTCQQPGSP